MLLLKISVLNSPYTNYLWACRYFISNLSTSRPDGDERTTATIFLVYSTIYIKNPSFSVK